MRWSETLRLRFRTLFRRSQVEQELDEELRYHLERQVEESIAAGMSPDDARRAARKEFGGLEQWKEQCRDTRGLVLLESVLQDLRYAGRVLRRSPVFTTVAVVSLALGIGANTVMFSLLDQATLRLLPVDQPDRLVVMRSLGPVPGMNRNSGRRMSFSYPMYRDLRDQNEMFSGVASRFQTWANLAHEDVTERVIAELVSGNYFEVLGVRPAVGRLFTTDDDRKLMGHPVAVLSYDFWMRRFGGDPSIVGERMIVNGQAMTAIGVSARGFHGLEIGVPVDVRVPMMMKDVLTPVWSGGFERRTWNWLNIVARLQPGLSREEAEAGMAVLYRQILVEEAKQLGGRWAAVREEFVNRKLELLPLAKGIRWWTAKSVEEKIVPLMAIAGLVLLITCLNLANLLLARTEARRRELSIRLALGAGRGRVGRQLVLEGLVLGVGGGALGFLLAWVAGEPLSALLLTEEVARAFDATPNLRLLLFTFVVALLTVVLFCAGPAIRPLRASLTDALKCESGASPGFGATRLRRVLVSVQVVLCLWLLLGAGLFVRTLSNLHGLDLGFPKENLLSFSVDLSLSGYDVRSAQDLQRRIGERLRALPGVSSVGYSDHRLLSGGFKLTSLEVEGYHAKTPEEMSVRQLMVNPGYGRTVGLQLLSGREFTREDESRRRTAIVNEAFATRFFGEENPVGKHLRYAYERNVVLEIVGLVRDQPTLVLRAEPMPVVYVPNVYGGNVSYCLRSEQHVASLIPAIRAAVRSEAPNVPLYNLKTMEARLGEVLHTENLIAGLLLAFGSLAVALAAVGIYGVMAYTVTRRTREIGIRMAIGAERPSVLWLVMRQATFMVTLGLAVGLPSGVAIVKLVEGYLFGVSPRDPAVIGAALTVLVAAGFIAGLLPAVRAAGISPVRALRYE